jgi:NTP pyrophosphatase (non-canonical NTP hydrolase)
MEDSKNVQFVDTPRVLLSKNEQRAGMVVRHGSGETAICRLSSPHAGGWHADHCMGGLLFVSGRLYSASERDMKMWNDMAKWRNEAPPIDYFPKQKQNIGLTFDALRKANLRRLPQFKNARGEPAHSHPEGNDWTPADWALAALGELGEAANLMKKIKRGDFAPEEVGEIIKTKLAWEFADVITYIDLLALQYHIDLGEVVKEKFNIVSERVGSDVFIGVKNTV